MRSNKRGLWPAATATMLGTCALLGGCAGTFSGGVELNAGGSAELSALGRSPYVELRNDGPGQVSVGVDLPGMELSEHRDLAPGAMFARRASRGPINLTIVAPGEPASVSIEARSTVGFSLRASNPPATPSDPEGGTP